MSKTAQAFRHALTVSKVAERFALPKHAAEKLDKAKLFDMLDAAQKTADNTGSWKGDFEGFNLWIGDPGGARSRQYEAQIRRSGRAIEFRARSFSSLKQMFLKHMQEFEG